MADPFYDLASDVLNEDTTASSAYDAFWDPISEFGYAAGASVGYLTGYSTERGVFVQEVKLSTAVNLRVTMRAADGTGPMTGLTLTVKIAKNGDTSFSTISPTVTPLGNGVYNIALGTTDTNTLGALSVHVSSTTVISGVTAIPETLRLFVIAVDKADAVRFGISSLPNAAAEAAGGLITRGTGVGQLSVTSGKADAQVKGMDTDTVNAAAVAADAVTEIQGTIPSSLTTINNKLGTPVAGTVSNDIADVKSDTSLLPAATPKIDELHKIGVGRWKIQGTQLLIYDSNGTTVLYAFDLKDDTGAPSATKIFERVPV